MKGDWLDLLIVALALTSAIRGYRRGLLVGLASIAGLVGGALVGSRVAPLLARHFTSSYTSGLIGIAVVVVAAVVVQEAAVILAVQAWRALGRGSLARTAHAVDSAAGAVLSVAALLFVSWAVAVALSELPSSPVAGEVRRSLVLNGIDRAIPPSFATQFSSLLRLAESRAFPPVFNHFGTGAVLPTPAPSATAVPASVLATDAPSVVKIRAAEPECSTDSEGTGFVVSRDHVLTNAHVVAGARAVSVVQDGAGRAVGASATVVLYDPHTDVAVLDVPGLGLPALRLDGTTAGPGADAAVVGYPLDGPFTVDPARVRSEGPITGPDIYQDAQVTRQVYAIRAVVEPGNSGGPLLAPSGSVYGVTFARSETQAETGFALTAGQVLPDVEAGSAATQPVSTQGCT